MAKKVIEITGGKDGLGFLDLLLDDSLCKGRLWLPRRLVREAGGPNKMLKAGRAYELVLRIARSHRLALEELEEGQETNLEEYVCYEEEDQAMKASYGWQTDAYLLGKYSRDLRANDCFDDAVTSVIQSADPEDREEVLAYLEKMLSRSREFYRIDDQTRPILLYKGDPVCYNVLTAMADQLGAALERAGERVAYFDLAKEDVRDIAQLMGHRYKAVIGIQSYLFSVKLEDEVHYVHEYIYGPKFNLIFDHPVWMYDHLRHHYPDFYVLTHDRDYLSFARRYYGQKAGFFPPAALEGSDQPAEGPVYDFTFVGTYGDYWQILLEVHSWDRPKRFLANRFLLEMRKHTDLSAEAAFRRALGHYGRADLADEDFLTLFHEYRKLIYCVMYYYRHRVVEEILRAGIRLDVFGSSWYSSRLRTYPGLVCHPDAGLSECVDIWRSSRLSLSLMSWHKAGFTERIAGIMLAGALLVTDASTYLEENYDSGEACIFHLGEFRQLPTRIRWLLDNEPVRSRMALAGQKKTRRLHTWDCRAGEFLQLLDRLADAHTY